MLEQLWTDVIEVWNDAVEICILPAWYLWAVLWACLHIGLVLGAAWLVSGRTDHDKLWL
jgi:hypothetical protein